MTKEQLQQIILPGNTNSYAILDGASVKGLRMRLYEMRPKYYCLFSGELEPDMEEVAPYLVGLIAGTPFTDWLLAENFGKHWGIFAHSRHSITDMRGHFRSLTTVYNEDGKPMIFRYYDPRVFNKFLLTCNPGELKTFFGNVSVFFSESGDGQNFAKFTLDDGRLARRELN